MQNILRGCAFVALAWALNLALTSASTPAYAQKDARGWDGTSSSMYDNYSPSGGSGWSGGSNSYGSSGRFDPTNFGKSLGQSLRRRFGSGGMGNTSSGMGGSTEHGSGLATPFGRISPNSSDNTPVGNPNPQWTPPATLSASDQYARNKAREQELAASRASQPVNPSTLQAQRWETEWRQQHPGQAVPSAGQLQQMHTGEIIQQSNAGWAQARKRWAGKRQEEYELATKLDQRLASQEGRSWNKADFDRRYDESHREHAQKYLESVLQSREISDRDAERRRWDEIGGR